MELLTIQIQLLYIIINNAYYTSVNKFVINFYLIKLIGFIGFMLFRLQKKKKPA